MAQQTDFKFPADIVHSGLIADLGPKSWSTYCVIISFMDEFRECYPTQEQIAERLGVSRQTANKYVSDLIAYRRQGRPIVRAIKERDEQGRFTNTFYKGVDIEWVMS